MATRIVFLNPPVKNNRKLVRNFDCASESKGNYLYQAYDFLQLSAKIPREWELSVLDSVASQYSIEDIYTNLDDLIPNIIVMSMADSNWRDDFNFLQELKKKYQKSQFFVFGDSFIDNSSAAVVTPYVSGILQNPIDVEFDKLISNDVNEYVSGPGIRDPKEYSKPDLKKPRQVHLGLPRHELFLHKAYRWPFAENFKYTTVFTAWGCPYSCSYCIMAKFPNFYRPAQEVIEELKYIKNLGIKEVYFGDRSFGLPRNNILEILKAMIDLKLNLRWSSYFHPNQYDEELLEVMKKSGCHTLIIGIESQDLKSLKQFNRNVKVNRYEGLLSHAKKLKIKICGDFMIGLPGEDYQDVMKTIDYSREIPIDYASFNIVAPLAGSSIKDLAIKENRMSENDKQFDSLGGDQVLASDKLTSTELIKLRNYAVKRFYMRPSYLFKRVLGLNSIKQFIIQFQEMIQLFKKSKT